MIACYNLWARPGKPSGLPSEPLKEDTQLVCNISPRAPAHSREPLNNYFPNTHGRGAEAGLIQRTMAEI